MVGLEVADRGGGEGAELAVGRDAKQLLDLVIVRR